MYLHINAQASAPLFTSERPLQKLFYRIHSPLSRKSREYFPIFSHTLNKKADRRTPAAISIGMYLYGFQN